MAHNVDVVVVGAGLSGLTTAYRLVRQGIDRVVVLEAKDRVGGRTLTTTVDGTVLDAGATIISPAQKDILALAADLGIRTIRSYRGRYVYLLHGERRTMAGLPGWAATPALSGVLVRLLSIAAKLPFRGRTPMTEILRPMAKLEELRRTVPPLQPWLAKDAGRLDGQSLQDWIDRETSPGEARQLLEYLFASYFAPRPERISLLYGLHVLNTWGGLAGLFAAQSNTLRFEGGAQSLSLAMAERLGGRVRLGSAVRVVAEIDGGYSVHTERNDFRATHVVLAVPPKNKHRIPAGVAGRSKTLTGRLGIGFRSEDQCGVRGSVLAKAKARGSRFGPAGGAGGDRHFAGRPRSRAVQLRGGGAP